MLRNKKTEGSPAWGSWLRADDFTRALGVSEDMAAGNFFSTCDFSPVSETSESPRKENP